MAWRLKENSRRTAIKYRYEYAFLFPFLESDVFLADIPTRKKGQGGGGMEEPENRETEHLKGKGRKVKPQREEV